MGQNYCGADGPSYYKNSDIQPFNHYLWQNWCPEVRQCNFIKAKKRSFLPFLDTKSLIAMKILGHHDKKLTPSESWYQDGFF